MVEGRAALVTVRGDWGKSFVVMQWFCTLVAVVVT